MKNDYFIYKYEWEDGSVYIGQSSTSQHRYGVIRSYKGCKKVYAKMIKHPNFDKCILKDGLNELEVDDFEIYYIKLYNSFYDNNPLGLNLTEGGHGCHGLSKESKQKISKAHKGKPIPECQKRKISQSVMGHTVSEETRQKLSEHHKGLWDGENNPMYGKRFFGKDNPNYGNRGKDNKLSNPILQIDKYTNDIIKVWDSSADVERELNFKATSLIACCRGRQKTAYGYLWRYADEKHTS